MTLTEASHLMSEVSLFLMQTYPTGLVKTKDHRHVPSTQSAFNKCQPLIAIPSPGIAMVEARSHVRRWVTVPRCLPPDGSTCGQAAHLQDLQAQGIGPSSEMPVVDLVPVLLPRQANDLL